MQKQKTLYFIAMHCLLCGSATAVEVESSLTLDVTYTDNIFLSLLDPQDEIVFRARPSIRLADETRRFRYSIDYMFEALRYDQLSRTESYHQYLTGFETALIPDSLFVDFGASRRQMARAPDVAIPRSNIPLSSNRQDRDDFYVSPRFAVDLSAAVRAEGNFRNSWVEFSEEDAATDNSEHRDGRLSIDNFRSRQGLAWQLQYAWERSEFQQNQFFEYQRATAQLGYWFTENFRVFATGGQESDVRNPLDPAFAEALWEAGFAVDSGENLSLEIAAGDRSFGATYRGQLEFNFRSGSTMLRYREAPSAQDRQQRIYRVGLETNELTDLLNRPGEAERFLSKRLDWSLTLTGRRTTVNAIAYVDRRSERFNLDAVAENLGDERQQGGRVDFDYRLGGRTTLTSAVKMSRRELEDGSASEQIGVSIGLEYSLGSRSTLSLVYNYDEEDAEESTVLRDYTANSALLSFTRDFFATR